MLAIAQTPHPGRALRAGVRMALSLALVVLAAGCEARLVTGAACARGRDCPEPLVCAAGRCRAECVDQRDCSLGGRCLVDRESGVGSCSLPDDPDCREPAHACPAGLLCVGDDCVNACETAATCPPGSACVLDALDRAYCERADADGGPGLDAGDAGPPPPDAPPLEDAPGPPRDAPCRGPACDPPVRVAVVPSASCALTAAGAIWCWGRGSALSLETSVPDCPTVSGPCSPVPVRARLEHGGTTRDFTGASWLAGGSVFSAVEAGRAFSWAGGWRTLGAAGAGEIARAVRVEPGATFLAPTVLEVRQGYTAALALTTDAEVYMWGDDDYAQRGAGVGLGSDFAERSDPLPGGSARTLGLAHGCGIRAGVVECWGENDLGQAGGATTGPGVVVATATPVPGLPAAVVTAVVAGRSQSCALVGGTPHCWGLRAAIGNAVEPPGCAEGGAGRACPPTPVTWPGAAAVALFGGPYSEDTCAVDAGGALSCWGPVSGLEPRRVSLPTPVTDVALGDLHACAVAAGEVWCWGANVYGQLGVGFAGVPMLPPTRVAWP